MHDLHTEEAHVIASHLKQPVIMLTSFRPEICHAALDTAFLHAAQQPILQALALTPRHKLKDYGRNRSKNSLCSVDVGSCGSE